MPFCETINGDCVAGAECPSRASGRQCWETDDAACCRRNDKRRCCFCSVYLSYLESRQSGVLLTVAMASSEDPRFASSCKSDDADIQASA